MQRSKILLIALIASLLPMSAWAGAPPASGIEVAPVFEDGSPSGIIVQANGGFLYGYNMNGTTVTGEGTLPAVPSGFTLVGNESLGWPDLDGNGITDIVVRAGGGFTYAYLLQDNGTFVNVLSEGNLPAIPAGFTLIGLPDLDGNGTTDIVVQAASGFTYAYLMSGTTVMSEGQIPGLPNSNYRTIGFPDLDGMNGADIVIQTNGGFTYAYLMTGLTNSAEGQIPGLPNTNYSTIGFPNLDGANGADIVIQATGGFTYAYLMNGLTTASEGQIPGLPTTAYSTIGFPNLDGMNGDDIVIQASGGFTYAYLMSGLTSTSDGTVPGLPTTAFSTIGFPNLDSANGNDIVIQAPGGFTYAYLMNGLTTASEGQIPGLPTTNFVMRRWTQSWAPIPVAP